MIVASASIPMVFQPVTDIDGLQLIDGGTFSNLNLQDTIDRCRELADYDSNITVDVIMCQDDPVDIPVFEKKQYFNVWHTHKQMKRIQAYYDLM
jgi:predicted acylesterase/phospholipase RssA